MASADHQNNDKGGCCGGHNNQGSGDHSHDKPAHGHSHAADHAAARVIDPVCGMTVDPATAKHRFAYKGQDYFFCSAGCRTKFEANPEKFLAPKSSAPEEKLPEGTIYTCPMHPEVRQVGPGS